jgi:hypothetical protein
MVRRVKSLRLGSEETTRDRGKLSLPLKFSSLRKTKETIGKSGEPDRKIQKDLTDANLDQPPVTVLPEEERESTHDIREDVARLESDCNPSTNVLPFPTKTSQQLVNPTNIQPHSLVPHTIEAINEKKCAEQKEAATHTEQEETRFNFIATNGDDAIEMEASTTLKDSVDKRTLNRSDHVAPIVASNSIVKSQETVKHFFDLQPIKLDGVTLKRKTTSHVVAYVKIFQQGDETRSSLAQSTNLLEDASGNSLRKQDGIVWSKRQEDAAERGKVSIEVDPENQEKTFLEVGIQSGNRFEKLVTMVLNINKFSQKSNVVMLKLQVPEKKTFFSRQRSTKFKIDAVECMFRNELILHSTYKIRKEISIKSIPILLNDKNHVDAILPKINDVDSVSEVDEIAVEQHAINQTQCPEQTPEIQGNSADSAGNMVPTGLTFESENSEGVGNSDSDTEQEEDVSEYTNEDKKYWSFDVTSYGMELKFPVKSGESILKQIKQKISKSNDSAPEQEKKEHSLVPIEERDSFSIEYVPPDRPTKDEKMKSSEKKKNSTKGPSKKKKTTRAVQAPKKQGRSRFVRDLIETDSEELSYRSGTSKHSKYNPSNYLCWLIPNDFRDIMLSGSASSKSSASSESVHSDHEWDATDLDEENNEKTMEIDEMHDDKTMETKTNIDDKHEMVAVLVKQLVDDMDGDSVATDELISIAAELNMSPSDLINAIEVIGTELEE